MHTLASDQTVRMNIGGDTQSIYYDRSGLKIKGIVSTKACINQIAEANVILMLFEGIKRIQVHLRLM